MTIPKSRAEIIFKFVIYTVVVSFVFLALGNLRNGVALIASTIWFALVTMMIWIASRKEGGLGRYLINRLGDLFGQSFVESESSVGQRGDIRFGFEFLGHRFTQRSVGIANIESVEWETGQGTAMAGRDKNDWHVCLWFDHNDPQMSEKQRKYRKPDQDIYIVGPSTRRDRTEALGLAFVDFLRAAGAELAQGATTTCFVRQVAEAGERKSVHPDAAPKAGPATPVGHS